MWDRARAASPAAVALGSSAVSLKTTQRIDCRADAGTSPAPSVSTMTGASAATVPGAIRSAKTSRSGVFSGDTERVAGTERRPVFTRRRAKAQSLARSSVASRKTRLISLFGVMKSVARVELRMFSSAAYSRSLA